jgi:uncharacterized membrane protein YheB (UPF0754 family)
MPAWLSDPDFWKSLSIPFVAAVVGWATNWVAVKMTFLPLEPVGRPPFLGWQGIIPSKAATMAATFVDSTMYRLGTLAELFEQMDPERIAEHVSEVLEPRLAGYVDEVMFWGGWSDVWRRTPQLVRERIYARVRAGMPRLVDELVAEVGRDIESLVDFKHMVVTQLVADKALLNRLFLEAGAAEFRFIVRSGLWFGFLFGLVQLAVWLVWPAWWVLPVFGAAVGWATNWIALNVIFRPLEPRRVGPWTVHGLFLRRQREVAGVWCSLVTREMLTVRQIIGAMLTGPRSERAKEVIRRHVRPVVDEAVGSLRPAAELTVGGPEDLERIRETVGEKAVEVSLEPFDHWSFNRERGAVIERLLRERMEALPPAEFQDLLRPCFQEDETKLIVLGGVLGLLAGVAQLVFVFGGAG